MTNRVQVFLFSTWFAAGTCFAEGGRTSVEKHGRAFAEKIHIRGISDAGKVNEFLFRGSQPNKAIAELDRLGVTLIVNLRSEFKGRTEQEHQQARALGIRFVTISGNGWSPPKDEEIVRFFGLIQEQPRQRIYVHCWLGGDRTGVFLAPYRIAFDHWEPREALQEMKAFHFKGLWHPAMKSYIRNFPERLATSPMLAPYRKIRRRPSYSRRGHATGPRTGYRDFPHRPPQSKLLASN
jgi:tyrosine-protein phosphatase SIW14